MLVLGGQWTGGTVWKRMRMLDVVRSSREEAIVRPSVASQETVCWTVLQVRSRQEKALSKNLGTMGITHFLPLMKRVQIYGGRRFTVELPLFPGYLFLSGSMDEVYAADRTRRVAKIIPVFDQKQLSWELNNLRLALESGDSLDPYPFLKKGVRVEVTSGPLRGLEGLVEDRAGVHRLILQIEMLGRAVSLEIDASHLSVVG
jgi:transcription antitermination factor NusG